MYEWMEIGESLKAKRERNAIWLNRAHDQNGTVDNHPILQSSFLHGESSCMSFSSQVLQAMLKNVQRVVAESVRDRAIQPRGQLHLTSVQKKALIVKGYDMW